MKTLKTLSMLCALMSSSVFAATIDTAFVIDNAVIASEGREAVDNQIANAIRLSNKTLSLAGLQYQREVKMVFNEEANSNVASATLGSGGALDGVLAACEEVKQAKYNHFDNVVWLVPTTGNVYRTGNEGYCNDTDHHVVVVAIDSVTDLSHVIAHELGHADGMSHASADSVYASEGKVLLMSSRLAEGLSSESELLTLTDISNMQNAALVADQWPKYFDQPRSPAPAALGTVSMLPEQTSLNFAAGEASFRFALSAPLLDDVSIEFYTHGIEAKPGVDYRETISRITLLAGQTEAVMDVPMITTAKRYTDKRFEVGVRYGDKVTADSKVVVTLTANATPAQDGGSGGGSLNPLYILFLLTLVLIRKVK
ncbi:SVAGG family GlyGly-CTERM protein [Vibrio cholerae]|nr:SVAGG family GlyGly-CTERM protein [Vibrio cholerae]EMA3788814.1 SVAGG family GlyGly-CTERM protein [Vibrio cholerae]